jgi:S-adenosyl methyltransferase
MATSGVGFRPEQPNVARMYDYMLGGKDNFPADRAAVRLTFDVLGEDVVRGAAQQNRRFLRRAVRHLAREAGIRQFLDIGTGLPTMGNVHEVARTEAPDSRIVYVDNDPVVISHAGYTLHGVEGTAIVDRDLRDPGGITGDARVRSVLRFDEPIAVLLVAILHFLADADDPAGIVAALMAAVPPGSFLVISHLSADHYAEADKAAAVYEEASSGLYLRNRAAVGSLFGGLPVEDPGDVVWTSQWHPDGDTPPVDSPGGASLWCGIARKPLAGRHSGSGRRLRASA